MQDLISIVIPVYNVEKYISKCIESVLEQTYENLEIILVDDGSTDSSGKICDTYACEYNNIVVIHKENGGLSSARNAGMKQVKGKYIMFLDSDDWIEPDTISLLWGLINNLDADMAAVKFNPIYSDEIKTTPFYDDNYTIFEKKEALATYLFNGYLSPCACGKLWKTEHWNNIEFPEGKLYEDQFTTYKVLERLSKSVLSNKKYYNYLKRENSIGHSKFSKQTYDLHDAINEECNYLINKYPEIKESLLVANIVWEIVFIDMMICSKSLNNKLIKEIRHKTRKNYKFCLRSDCLNRLRKMQILLFAYFFSFYRFLYKIYKINHKYS